MAVEIKLPQWAMTLTEGTILEWKKKVGDYVAVGDALCQVEENKATMDLESPAEGVLLKICVAEGETVPVLTVICILGNEGETA